MVATIGVKSALKLLIERSDTKKPGKWLRKGDPEAARLGYVQEIGCFSRSVKIVAGEANHKLFNRPDFIASLRYGLTKHPESNLKFVFHKADQLADAKFLFKQDNMELVTLKREFDDRVHIYWSPVRPLQHYAVIDDEKVILEEPGHKPSVPFWAYVSTEVARAKDWEALFDEYVSYCEELSF